MKARRRQPTGSLTAGISKRDGAVLDAGGVRVDSVLYDFSYDGGAVKTYNFSRYLEKDIIITRVFTDEITALTSGGAATLQLKAGSTNLTDALAFDTGFAGTEQQDLASSAEAIKLSVDSELRLEVATAALTAGKVRFYVEYMIAND